MSKLVYFHGFASSGASGTVLLLRKHFITDRVLAPDIPLDPAEALPFLKEFCAKEQPDLVIGTSMGAMYAQQMRGFLRICVNPSFYMSRLYSVVKVGAFDYSNKRENGEKKGHITKDTIKHFKEMEAHQFEGITPEEKELCYGLFGRKDPVVHCHDDFVKYYPHAGWFDGEHRLNDTILTHTVVPLAKKLLGR